MAKNDESGTYQTGPTDLANSQQPSHNSVEASVGRREVTSSYIDSPDWDNSVHRGFGKTNSWDGKYLHGAFSSIVASYVIGYEHFSDLPKLNDWRSNPAAADAVVKSITERYASITPREVAAIVDLAKSGEIGEMFSSRLNHVSSPEENLDFMHNVMADYKEVGRPIDTSRMDMHGEGDEQRVTLEPVPQRWLRESPRGFEAELHRGGYAIPFNIPQNTIAADLAGYLTGDRAFETDVLDTLDKKAVLSHEFSLNQQTGEYYKPERKVKEMTEAEVTSLSYGSIDPDMPFPNARKSAFNISTLASKVAFHDRYLPGASLSLDARNMSSITSIVELDKHYSEPADHSPGGSDARPGSASVKVYTFLLAHGYEQALAEYASRKPGSEAYGFETMKYWRPEEYRPWEHENRSLTEHERREVELRSSRAPSMADKAELEAITKCIDFRPSSDDRRQFDEALLRVPLVLCVGGVLKGDPRQGSEAEGRGLTSPFRAGELKAEMKHEGSDSVLSTINLRQKDPSASWKTHAPFGCANEPSDSERRLTSQGVKAFSHAEREYIQYATLKTLAWISTFAPHANSKTTVQLQSQPALEEIINEAKAVKEVAQHAHPGAIGEDYSRLQRLSNSALVDRMSLINAAVNDNVHHLFSAIADGKFEFKVYEQPGKTADLKKVQTFFSNLRLSGFDRYSDFSLMSDGKAPGIQKQQDYVFNVVKGEIKDQPRSTANQTGRTSHDKEDMTSATTDIPVEAKQKGLNKALHKVDHLTLPSPDHITVSQRSVMRRQATAAQRVPESLRWGKYDSKMPSKEEVERATRTVRAAAGVGSLQAYTQRDRQVEESAQRRQLGNERLGRERSGIAR